VSDEPSSTDGAARRTERDDLPRVLSGMDAGLLAIGLVIGTGIFVVPGGVAQKLGSPGPILLAWILGGLISLAGALTFAELASMLPRQGGAFVYVFEAFGPFAAFFKGWGSFLIGYPAAAAAIATVFGIYAEPALGLPEGSGKVAAFLAVTLVWWLNLRGTKFSGRFQAVLTAVKILALAAVAVLAMSAGSASWARLFEGGDRAWPPASAFALALVGVLWTYDGWANATVVGGEVVNPQRSLVRGLLGTITLITALYLAVNVGFLVLLPVTELAGTDHAATLAAEAILGSVGGRIIACLILLSSFGALFANAVAAPRFFFAMAREGLFFQAAGRVHGATAAPRWGQAALYLLTTVYLFTGSFQQIVEYYAAVALIYGVLAVLAVYVLRRKHPDWERPFRVPGYPVTPAVFVLGALWVVVSVVHESPGRSAVGLLVLLASAPAYLYWKRRREVDGPGA
jgi:APA family basic amino acid/polyamine antiporter